MATKHGKMVTHRKGLQLINSHNTLNIYLREVTGQIKTIIPPPPGAIQ